MEVNIDPIEQKGAFVESLKRNNAKIKADRANQIADSATRFYRRKVEDIAEQIKNLKVERESLLDLSPTNVTTLIMASDFKPDVFVETDIRIGVEIRQLEIKLEIAKDRYEHLFEDAKNAVVEKEEVK